MTLRRLLMLAAGLLALVGCAAVLTSDQAPLHPELIVVNARVATADERFSIHEALAVIGVEVSRHYLALKCANGPGHRKYVVPAPD